MTSKEMIASIAVVAIVIIFYVSIQKNTAEAQIEMIKAQTEFYGAEGWR